MAGREDFGVLKSDFFADERALTAADIYRDRLGVPEAFAFGAVAGHVATLGMWAMQHTDDGVLKGDGVAAVFDALRVSRSVATAVVGALKDAKLLREVDGGLYLVGFKRCYRPILERRADNAETNRLSREEKRIEKEERKARIATRKTVSNTSCLREQDVSDTSRSRQAPPSEPCRAVSAVPSEPSRDAPSHARDGGSSASLPNDDDPLDGRDIAGLRAALAVMRNGKHKPDERALAERILGELNAGTLAPSQARKYLRIAIVDKDARIANIEARKLAHP